MSDQARNFERLREQAISISLALGAAGYGPEPIDSAVQRALNDLIEARAATDAAERERDKYRQWYEALMQTRMTQPEADLAATRTALEQAERDNRSFLAELAILRPQLDEARAKLATEQSK